jgi:predicted O-methyltransferase YrrM
VEFLPGSFADTLPRAGVKQLALLRVAGDLYEPTMIALRSMYPKLAKGGYFLIDHYGALESCREAVDDFRAEFGITEPVEQIDWTGAGWRVERPIAPIPDVLSVAKGLTASEPERLSLVDDEPALHTLLRIYGERPDLQEAYPEASHWDFRRLVDWARHSAGELFGDSSSRELKPFREWFEANAVAPPRAPFGPVSPPWSLLQEASAKSANPLPGTLQRMRSSQSTEINAQLMTLALLVSEFGLRQIVELGVGGGHSTLALLEAARAVGGRVFSLDIEPCHSARRLIEAAGLAGHWTFQQANALLVGQAQIPRPIDLLFIDTFHLYTETLAELQKWIPYVRAGGWIALHETVSSPGVSKAIGDILATLPRKPRFYAFAHQNGLSLIRLAENGTANP